MATRNLVPRTHKEGGLGKAGRAWANGYINEIFSESITTATLSNLDGSQYATEPFVTNEIDKAISSGFQDVNSNIYKALMSSMSQEMASVLEVLLSDRTSNASQILTAIIQEDVKNHIVIKDLQQQFAKYKIEINNALQQHINDYEQHKIDINNALQQHYNDYEQYQITTNNKLQTYIQKYEELKQLVEQGGGGTGGNTGGNTDNPGGNTDTPSATSGLTLSIPWFEFDSNNNIINQGTHTHTVPEYWVSTDTTIVPSASPLTEQTGTTSANTIGSKTDTSGYRIELPWIEYDDNGKITAHGTSIHTIPHYWEISNDVLVPVNADFTQTPFTEVANLVGSKTNSNGLTVYIPTVTLNTATNTIINKGVIAHTVSSMWEEDENHNLMPGNGSGSGSSSPRQGLIVTVPWVQLDSNNKVINQGTHTHTIPDYWNTSITEITPELNILEEISGTTEANVIGSKTNTSGYNIELPWVEYDNDGNIVNYGHSIHTIPHYWEIINGELTPVEADFTQTPFVAVSNLAGSKTNSKGLTMYVPMFEIDSNTSKLINRGVQTHQVATNWTVDTNNDLMYNS